MPSINLLSTLRFWLFLLASASALATVAVSLGAITTVAGGFWPLVYIAPGIATAHRHRR
jgi:hypothetical protein